MGLANDLLSMCIVEDENNCKLENATQLLEVIDEMLGIIDINADVVVPEHRSCFICGRGKYQLKVDGKTKYMNDYNIHETPKREWWVYVCNNCGHVQYFARDRGAPNPW